MRHARFTVAFLLLAAALPAFSDHPSPGQLQPVTNNAVRYVVPNDKGLRAYVEAFDVQTGRKLWTKTIFRHWYIPPLGNECMYYEYLTSLSLRAEKLTVRSDCGRVYTLDTHTRAVRRIKTKPNKADAPNAAMALRFHSDHHGRGVGDLRRSAYTRTRTTVWLPLTLLTCLFWSNEPAVTAQAMPAGVKKPEEIKFKQPSFTFARIRYSAATTRRASWFTDFPDADLNFTTQFQKVTGLKCDTNGMVLELTDAKLKQQPFIYISEGGQMRLKPEEMKSLRAYLLGGGFLMVDDFWGEAEWNAVATQFRQVFPDREPVELPLDHAVFRCFYEIREKPQVPNVTLGIQSQFTGITWERADAKQAHYRGLVGDDGRLMVIFCHNTDLGDGWERADEDEYYYREFSLKRAYPMGINIVVYALTH